MTQPAPRQNWLRRLYAWVLSWAHSPFGTAALFVIAFAESSFFPIPPDVLQIALSVARPRRAFFYAAVATVGSVLGGLAGWYIGHFVWEAVSGFFFTYVPGFTQEIFDIVKAKYNANAFLAVFGAAFTPIPYKVFTIAAGACEVPLQILLVASVAGRGLRFFLVGSLIFFFGPKVKGFLDKYFELATVALLLLGVAGFVAIKYLA